MEASSDMALLTTELSPACNAWTMAWISCVASPVLVCVAELLAAGFVLEAEGWVRFQPNVGALVAPADATTWEQEMAAAAILEGAATADAATRLCPSDMARLRGIAAEMERVATEGDPVQFGTLNRCLHATIVARCANAYLVELLEQTYTRLDRVRSAMLSYLPERFACALAEHARLLNLLESGDTAEIERYARWHKMQAVEAYRALHHQAASGSRSCPSQNID